MNVHTAKSISAKTTDNYSDQLVCFTRTRGIRMWTL